MPGCIFSARDDLQIGRFREPERLRGAPASGGPSERGAAGKVNSSRGETGGHYMHALDGITQAKGGGHER